MKKILLLTLVLLFSTGLFAQTYTPPSFAEVDNNYRNYVNQVFGALEPNRVTTGLLADYGFDFTDPKIYNGIVLVDSTLMEQGTYSELYKTIFTSRFNSNITGMRHPGMHDSMGFAAFGSVFQGMTVVRKIQEQRSHDQHFGEKIVINKVDRL